ncbi:Oxidase ustYa [Hypsizygus marmoreus]|uniref:Oxidase ustYa n=1 Tax=Hypsizygus marmoreus TaxID=39966 RepID=A0A369JRE8_HYPMA|nr:Oxidase ustYa [Hypsizygus marmoreus]
MTPEESVHYKLETAAGALAWKSMLPRGRGVIYLNDTDSPAPFRVAMFHQLECLDVVREEILKRRDDPGVPASGRANFCLNYLRQSILCHADSHLEMVRSEYGGRAVLPYTVRTDCVDWEAVWREAERNYDAHSKESRRG